MGTNHIQQIAFEKSWMFLSGSNYHLFPAMKTWLVKRFVGDVELMEGVTWLKSQMAHWN
ncbi:hypothetical protein J6590_026673 [Homalodisca vitripennis]|nr:hypothetical protein J6590_026673 [Homalodisca vitripennis]